MQAVIDSFIILRTCGKHSLSLKIPSTSHMPASESRKRRREQHLNMMGLPCFCHPSAPPMAAYPSPPSVPQIPIYSQLMGPPMPAYSQPMGPPMPAYSQLMGPPMPSYSQLSAPPMSRFWQPSAPPIPAYPLQSAPPMPVYSQPPVRFDDALRSFIHSIGRPKSIGSGKLAASNSLNSSNGDEPKTSSSPTDGRSMPNVGASRKRRIDSTLPPDIANFTHECPICLDELIEPKQLHCGHNLCPNCVNNDHVNTTLLHTSTAPADMQGKSVTVKITCPLCKQVTESTKPLATNYALKETVEKAKRMKLYFEAEEYDKSSEPSITCAECGGSCEEKRAIACLGTACVSRRRVTNTNLDTNLYGRSYTIVSCKQLCAYCACRAHRGHDVWPLRAMASENLIEKTIRNTTALEKELRRLWSDLQMDDEIHNISETVLSTSIASLKDYNRELRHPAEPLRKGLVEAIQYRNSQFVERVKAVICDKEKMKIFRDTFYQAFKPIEEKIAYLLK